MTIKMIKTGAVMTVANSLGLRLIEQGKAVPSAPVPKKTARKGEANVAEG